MVNSRQSALERFKTLLIATRAGKTQLALLQAQAGFGKSYLLSEFAKTLPANTVFTVRDANVVAGLLHATHSILQSERDSGFLSAARHYAPELNWSVVAAALSFEPERAWLSIAHALERMALRLGGLCFLLEDVHEFNSDAVHALGFMYRQWLHSGAPILLVLSARPNLPEGIWNDFQSIALIAGGATPERLELNVLDAAGISSLIEQVLPGAVVPNDLKTWIFAFSEGHPLYATELLRYALTGGAVQNLGATWQFVAPAETAVPRNLEALLLARLELAKAEAETWLVLSSLAVLGVQNRLEVLKTMTGLSFETLQRAIRRLLTLGLLRSHLLNNNAHIEITHPLYSPLIESLLTQAEVGNLHTQALAVTPDLNQRARHARVAKHDLAFDLSLQAFEYSIKQYAWADVEQHGQALLEMGKIHNPTRVLFFVGRAMLLQNRYTQAISYFAQLETPEAAANHSYALARLVRDREGKELTDQLIERHDWAVRYYWTCFPMRLGMRSLAEERLGQAFALSQNDSDERICALFCEHWFIKIYHAHRLARQLEIFQEVRRLEVKLQPDETPGWYNYHAEAYADLGELRIATEVMDNVLERFRLKPDDSAQANHFVSLGRIAFLGGAYQNAKQHFMAALRIASGSLDPIHQSYAHFGLYRCDYAQGLETKAHLERYETTNARMEQSLYDAPTDLEIAWREVSLKRLDVEARARLTERLSNVLGADCLAAARLHLLEGNNQAALVSLKRWQPERWLEDGVQKTQTRPAEHALLEGMALRSNPDKSAATKAFNLALELASDANHWALSAEIQLAVSLVAASPNLAALDRLRQLDALGHTIWLRQLYPGAIESLEFAPESEIIKPTRFIRTFGAFGLEENGKLKPWKAQKTRDLLALLICASLEEGTGFVSREQIIDTVWAESNSENADGLFRMTISRLRDSLGDAATIERDSQGRYGLTNAKLDTKYFLESLANRDLERAAAWYTGTFLPNTELEKAETLREKFRHQRRNALLQLAFENNDARAAIYFENLLETDPFDLEALRGLGKSWQALGANLRLVRILEKSKDRFNQEIGEVPSELTDLLHHVRAQVFVNR